MSRPASKSPAAKCVVLRSRFLSCFLFLSISMMWCSCSQGRTAAAPSSDTPTTTGATSGAGENTTRGKELRDEEKFSEATDRTLNQRREEIRSEIRALGDHPWAGEYYEGDGLGVNISFLVAPGAGYIYDFRSDVGPVDRNYGAVTFKDGKLHLSFTLDNKRERHGIAEEYLPVSWGERRYLIPPDRIEAFCNDVNSGTEPRAARESMWMPGGAHLVRRGDRQKAVEGFPDLPAEYRALLLQKPIESEVIGITSSTARTSASDIFRDYIVRVRGGEEEGLAPGMHFYVIVPESGAYEAIIVSKAGDGSSEATMTRLENKGKAPNAPMPGWKLSTVPTYLRNVKDGRERKVIDTEIVAVETSTTRPVVFTKSTVEVRGGRDVGLRPGMQLYVDRRLASYISPINVTVVGDKTSEGVASSGGILREPEPQLGWKMSTQAPWRLDAVESRSKEKSDKEGTPALGRP